MKARSPVALAGLLALGVVAAAAEEPAPPREPTRRPGRIAVGPFYVTARLYVESLGFDSNVFQTATQRQADFVAAGGPGLEIVLPARPLTVSAEGRLHSLYFVRSRGQRRMGGTVRGRLEWGAGRVRASLEEVYEQRFERLGYELDARVLRETRTTRGQVQLRLGRWRVQTTVAGERFRLPDAHTYLGTDLRRTLSRNSRRLAGELRLRLSAKTSVLVGGDRLDPRFIFASQRDFTSTRAYGGLVLDSETRLAGRVRGGAVRSAQIEGSERQATWYADVDLTWHFGPRTRARARLGRDLLLSAFDVAGGLPALLQTEQRGRIERDVTPLLDLGLWAARVGLTTRGAVTLDQPQAGTQRSRRADTLWQVGAELGFRPRDGLRVALNGGITSRRSSFADLGIEGLLLGVAVTFVP